MLRQHTQPVFSGKKTILLAGLLLLITTFGFADRIVVDCDGGGDYYTIQAGINAAQNGDEVYVEPGIYNERIVIPNKEIEIHGFGIESGPQTIIRSDDGDVVVANNTTAEWEFYNFQVEPDDVQDHGIKLTNVDNAHLSVHVKGAHKTFNAPWSRYVEKGGGIYIKDCNNLDIWAYMHQCWARYGGCIYCENSNVDSMLIYRSFDCGAWYGGTLYVKNSIINKLHGSSITGIDPITHEWFYPSKSYYGGGFICAYNSDIYVAKPNCGGSKPATYEYGIYCCDCNIFFNGYGGAIALTNGSYMSIDSESYFENCSSTFAGGAIYVDESDLTINSYTEFIENSAPIGGSIYFEDGDVTVCNCVFEDNEASSKGGAIGSYNCDHLYQLNIENCTFVNNNANDGDCLWIEDISNCSIVNTIFWGQNDDDYIYFLNVPHSDITYCCLQLGEDDAVYGGETFNNNISDNPLLDYDYTLKWDATHFSPCIDTGDPNPIYDDADGTPADMGAIPTVSHDYFKDDYDEEEFDHIDWISFPVLNRTTNNWMNAINVLEGQKLVFPGSPNDDILDYVLHEDIQKIYYSSGSWQNYLGDFDSKQGYIFVLQDGYDDIPVQGISGTWLDRTTPIQLYANKVNWVGCFLPEPIHILDALESIEDEWLTVRSEHWYAENGGWTLSSWTANPGELYKISVEHDCQLIWNNTSGGIFPFLRAKTDYFTYTETVDYMAINIDTVYSDTSITEIGVFSNGTCLGATKVYDNNYPVQILAYTPQDTKGGEDELTFRVYYDDQKNTESKSVSYITYNREAQEFSSQPIAYKQSGFARVQLNKKGSSAPQQLTLLQNYPNPVKTSTTTIRFMPQQDAAHTELNIYNIRGQLVRTIDCDGIISSGTKDVYYSITWDCRDRHGKDVKSGIYFYKLTSGEKSAIHKMLLMK